MYLQEQCKMNDQEKMQDFASSLTYQDSKSNQFKDDLQSENAGEYDIQVV